MRATAPSLPDVFLPYQQRLMESVATHSVTVVEKSRRTGYSWAAGAIAALTAAAARGEGGMDVLYMGYEKEMTREFIGYVADWARQFDLAARDVEEVVWTNPDRPEQEIGAFRIRFASGFEVVALPSVPRALRGKQGLVILDEAAFMDDLEEVLKAALALLIWGGKVLVISTHNGEANPFNELVNDIRGGRKPYTLLRCTLDDALADGLYRRICFTTGQEWTPEAEAAWRQDLVTRYGAGADEELFCIPSPLSGTWLPGALIEARMDAAIPVLRWQAPPGFVTWPEPSRAAEVGDWLDREVAPLLRALDPTAPHALGQDFARKRDLSVIWPLAIGRDLVKRTPFVVELRDMPFAQQKQVLFHIADRLPLLRGMALDANGNGMAHAEAAADRYGERVIQAMLTEPWYREHMPPLKVAFEDASITIPKDRDIATDFRLVRLVRGVPRVVERTADEAGQRHGDAAIAAALAVLAAKAAPVAYGYEPVPLRRAGATIAGMEL
jgi:phage FluMu gp28-like protein